MSRTRIAGVAFELNETVEVAFGPRKGAVGTVVSLLEVEPEATYMVELSSGEDAELRQWELLSESATSDAWAIAELQRWYATQCDDRWEHSFGITIQTLDNPGWMVTVDLEGTGLESRPFDGVSEDMEGPEWVSCRVEARKFIGACGPGMVCRVAREFLRWAAPTSQGAA